SGTDTFIYRAGDGTDASNVAMVTIAVNPLNDAPVAQDDRFEIYEGETRVLAPAGALANDTDADGDPLSLVVVDAPQHGTVTTDADGNVVYTPAAGFTGEDTLTYRAADGQAESNLATITISVLDSNRAPVAHDDAYTVTAGQKLSVFMPGVLANDVDADGDWLIAMVVGQPSHGTFSADPLGGFTYTPADGFTGIDTFTYSAADQRAFSAPATVTITVLPAGTFVA
ncbi:MAG: tandem-95 repeat protein, partial [Planctomycetes bacterium]|nr:tandem-95 repeat protein [Planctomycetota bacterium]